MAASSRVACGDHDTCPGAPGREDPPHRLGCEIRPVREADDCSLATRAERCEPAAKRGSGPALPVRALDYRDAVEGERVSSRDDDDLVDGALGEPFEHAGQ